MLIGVRSCRNLCQRRWLSGSQYDHFLSLSGKARCPSAIRALQPLLKIPGMISLGGGLPNPSLFPFKSLSIELHSGTVLELTEKELGVALQYSNSYGLDELVVLLKNHQKNVHNLANIYKSDADWGVLTTTGSQDAFYKTFDLLFDRGDTVLVENPTYSGAIAAIRPMGVEMVGIPIDGDGIKPDLLLELLQHWTKYHPNKPKPKVLYTIPTGQNPSGATLPNERRRTIYSICCAHNILILEDDPYWDLRFTDQVTPLESFISMDKENRVIRFDSFSKTLSSGMRIGYATGPQYLLEKIQYVQQASSLHASGISQAILVALLNKWGEEGLAAHIHSVRAFYTNKKNLFLELCEKHLKEHNLAIWNPPKAGMFVWFKIGVDDTTPFVNDLAVNGKVLMVPGSAFTPDGSASPYVRASFSTASIEDLDEALRRFSAVLQEKDLHPSSIETAFLAKDPEPLHPIL